MDPRTEAQIAAELVYHAERKELPPGYVTLPPIPAARYTRQDFYDLEMERIFRRSWLCAGREEDIKESGSYVVWDKLGPSIVIVRGKDDKVRAFYNSCQHRGARVVKEECGRGNLLRCQYHSWAYDLEGKLVAVPDDERDFGCVNKTEVGLKPVACETWGGWIFLNLDPKPRPFAEEYAPIIDELDFIKMGRLRIIMRYSKLLPCSWKAACEAFQEAYHTQSVHALARVAVNVHAHSLGLLPEGHSRMVSAFFPGKATESLQVAEAPRIDTLTNIFKENSFSYLFFPNLATAQRATGMTFIMMWPRSLRETEIQSISIAPDWGEGERPAYYEMYNNAYVQLLEEDFGNLSSIQNSMESGALETVRLGWSEQRIYWSNQEIDKRIGLDRVPPELAVEQVLSGPVQAPVTMAAE